MKERMLRINYIVALIVIVQFILIFKCQAQRSEDSIGVYNALRLYEDLVTRMNADSIGTLFAEDGALVKSPSESIIGPRAVREYLKSFSAFHVLSHRMHCDTLIFENGYAIQAGEYRQQVRIPSGDTVNVAGTFHVEWQRWSAAASCAHSQPCCPPVAPPCRQSTPDNG